MLDDIYNAKILEFAGNIPRIGRLEHPDASAKAHSKLCGSTVIVDLSMKDGVVTILLTTSKPARLARRLVNHGSKYHRRARR